jgi:signal transduction histidine kinase
LGTTLQGETGFSSSLKQNSTDDVKIAWATLNALRARLCVIDEHGEIIATNRAWREFNENFTDPLAKGEGESRHSFSAPWMMCCWREDTASRVSLAVEELLAGKRDSFILEYEFGSGESVRWFETYITRLQGDGPIRLAMSHIEITNCKRTENALKKSSKRLKELGAHLESVREEQSAMIARELHDELGALLTMLKLDLALTAEQVASTDETRGRFSELLDKVQTALQVVKRISTNLRPAMLDTLGLMSTIRWYVEQFSRSTDIDVDLKLPEYVRLSDISNIAVFRIIQEGLTNVAEHSGANRVQVHVSKDYGSLIVEIADNGKGIAQGDMQRQGSFGIIGMNERAQYLGGTFSICGKSGLGTTLTLRIPMDS